MSKGDWEIVTNELNQNKIKFRHLIYVTTPKQHYHISPTEKHIPRAPDKTILGGKN